VVIKKPISSKKSKSLENINKKTKKTGAEKAIIDMYKKQYQQLETCEQTRNTSSNN
jgi:hypothetical protein